MPRRFALLWSLVLGLGLLFAPAHSAARTIAFPQNDVELEVPEDWEELPPPAGGVAFLRSADKKRTAVLVIGAFHEGMVFDAAEFALGVKKAAQANGGIVIGEEAIKVGPLAFQTLKIAATALGRTQSYLCTTFANHSAFTLALNSDETDASTDPELATILRGLRFLHPPTPVVAPTGKERFSIQMRGFVSRHVLLVASLAVLLLALIAGGIWLLVKRNRARPAPFQPPVQQF